MYIIIIMENTDASNKIIDISSNIPQQKQKKRKSYKALMRQIMKPQTTIEEKIKQFHNKKIVSVNFKKIDKI